MFYIGGAALLSGIVAGAIFLFASPASDRPDVLLHVIKMEPISLTVVERGALESAFNEDVVCHVKATTKGATSSTSFKWVIDDGTEVKKGQLIADLDSSALEDQYTTQKIAVEQAEANYINASENVKIVLSQNESDEKTAGIAIELAQIDLEKYTGLPKGTIAELSRDQAIDMLRELEKDFEGFMVRFRTRFSRGSEVLIPKGEFQQAFDDVNGRIELASSDVESSKDRTAYSQRMALKGFLSASQVQSDESKLESSQQTYKKTQTEREILLRYTVPRTIKDLSSKVQEAWRAYSRITLQSKAKEIQATTDRDKKKSVFDQERKRLDEISDQIQICKIYAPQTGMVVYYVPETTRFGGGSQQSIIAQGEPVKEGQKIIRIPDLSRMLVSTKVHEAMISKIRGDERKSTGFTDTLRAAMLFGTDPLADFISQHESVRDTIRRQFRREESILVSKGQDASIRTDAYADRLLKGHVRTVATVAAQQDFFSPDVKVYQVMVAIDESVTGLKPGMSAEVTIHIEDLTQEVPAIPVQAIIGGAESGRTRKCLVQTPTGPQEREIVLGLANDRIAEIKEGLQVGERVILNPKVVLGEKIKTMENRGGKGTDARGKGEPGKGGPGGPKGKSGGMPKGGMPPSMPGM